MEDVTLRFMAAVGALALLCLAIGLATALRLAWDSARPEPAQAPSRGSAYDGADVPPLWRETRACWPERDEGADNDDRAAEMRERRSVRVDHAEADLAAHYRLSAESSDPERRAWYCN